MRKEFKNNCLVALLIVGSAISLLSCSDHTSVSAKVSLETLMSEMSDTLTVVVSENGRPSYRFYAPLVEGYSLAKEPYREFRKGVNIITYLDDSLLMVDATLRSNYAIYYSNLKLWEAKGDVVVIKHDGKELYTQQLFWNSTTKRIYSNVDTKIVDTNNDDVYIGEGFESDEQMKEWSFRKMKGTMRVDTTPTPADSVATKSQRAEPGPKSTASAPKSAPAASPKVASPAKSTKSTSRKSSAQSPQRVQSTAMSSKVMPSEDVEVVEKANDETPFARRQDRGIMNTKK